MPFTISVRTTGGTWRCAASNAGIDVRLVVETGLMPTINTGVAHKKPGVGQVGAGVVKAPRGCFEKALVAFAGTMGVEA